MTRGKLKAAIDEAKRFLRIAEAVNITQPAAKSVADYSEYYSTSKETGATKRASMDLSRTLAELRKP